MRLAVDLAAPLVVGATPLGARFVLAATGGSFRGPDLEGDVLPCGGDWVLDRRDGVADLDIRFVLRTSGGELVDLRCFGIFDGSAEVRQRLRNGESVDPAEYYFRTCARFETGSSSLSRLNRIVCVGVGTRTRTGMVTEIFAVK